MDDARNNRSARCSFVRSTGAAVLLLCFGVLRLAAAEHHGQVKFGGLPVPGATVTAVQGEKKLVAITDPQGNYSFPDLPDGVWTLQVEMPCFAPAKQDIAVAAGAPAAEWELKLLPLSEIHAEAKVTPAPPAPQTGASGSGANANKTNPAQAGQQPRSAANTQDSFQRTDLNATGTNMSAGTSTGIEGQNADDLALRASDGYLISGSQNNSASSPFGLIPAFGNFRKGIVSLYNGNIGLILDNSALDARSYSFTGQNTAKPAYNRMTGVASFGGPLKIPHLVKNGPMVAVNYQWTRNRNATTQAGLVPTKAERDGDFSQVTDVFGRPVQIFDPATGSQFYNNVIPKERISSQANALLKLYPLPTFTGGGPYNYQIPVINVTHQDGLQARVVKVLGRSNQLFGTFDFQSTRTDNPNLFGFLDKTDTTGINSGVNWRHTFTMRFVLNLGYQYSRLSSRATPFFANSTNISGAAGISGNNQEPVNWGPPDLVFSGGVSTLSDGHSSFNRNQTNAFSYAMYWNRGRHNLSWGADFRRLQFNYLAQQDPRGTFTFTGAATQARLNTIQALSTGSDVADFLLGVPDASSIAFGNADKYFRASSYDAYFTDDFRISPSVTMNAGLRWEYNSPITELYGRLVNLDIAPGFGAVAPVVANQPAGALTAQHYPDSLIHPDKRGFQPRIGFAWRPIPASSLVVRAGYGIYFNTSVYTALATQMAQQSPLSKSLSMQNSSATPLTLANGFNGTPAGTANTFAIDPNFRVGYVQTWQLSIQRDLPLALIMSATYSGSKGTRGVQQFLPNTYPAGTVNPCSSCPSGYFYLTSNGNSTREAGQVQLRRRLQSGFTATLQYTLSKSIDDATFGPWTSVSGVKAQNWLDLSAERGLSNFDQRHLMSLMVQYTSGMGLHGGSLVGGWRGRLFKEWTITTQLTAGSGLPLTPVYLTPVNGTGVTGVIRPEVTGASLYAAPPGLFLNPAAYAAPALGQWGNAARNSIIGPAQFGLNASFGRTFRVHDRIALDLRVDSANAINRVNFTSWNTMVTSAQFGQPTVPNPMRTVQTTLRARF